MEFAALFRRLETTKAAESKQPCEGTPVESNRLGFAGSATRERGSREGVLVTQLLELIGGLAQQLLDWYALELCKPLAEAPFEGCTPSMPQRFAFVRLF